MVFYCLIVGELLIWVFLEVVNIDMIGVKVRKKFCFLNYWKNIKWKKKY